MRLGLIALLSCWWSLPALAQEAPVVVDVTYELGPGDRVMVEVVGQPDMSGSRPIEADGSLDVTYVGRVNVGGRTLASAEEQIEASLRNGVLKNPQVVLRVEQVKSKRVSVTGGVNAQGDYPLLSANVRVSDALVQAGGLIDPASPRAEITRDVDGQRQIIIVDLERLRLGDVMADYPLHPGDTLTIPQAQQVFVDGQVAKPGGYVLRDGMTITEAVAAAGGTSNAALSTRVKLIRGADQIVVNLKRIRNGQEADVALKPGDHVYIPESAF